MAAIRWEDSWCNGWLVQQVQQVQQDDCTAVRTTVARWVLWQLPQIVAPNLQHRLNEERGHRLPVAIVNRLTGYPKYFNKDFLNS